ncbi:MAG: oligosaccharide flippase family protein, partial [Chitinophagaceae bacterium]
HTGKWLIMTAMLQWWSGNLFIVAAGLYLGAAAFGAIRLAQNLFSMLNLVLQVFENYVVPRAAQIYKTSSQNLRSYLRSVSVKVGLLFVPLSLALGFFARPVLGFLGGEQYESYGIAVQGLAVLQLLIFLSYPIRIAIRVLLLNKVFFIGYIITSLFSVLAARTFIQWGNLEGVIAGLLVNQVLIIVYWQVMLHRSKFDLAVKDQPL